ncbi:hypothetical protein DH2020_049273 [Rehmannia glutinosa]|uniref:Protein kinase domain-containing protein n=1 Tax=Rehmannia glutinosa TaxID=99300 RepID=A0ABR0U3W8_REHGL
MPFPLQVVLNYELKGLILSRTWSKFASGQIATSIGFFNSRNFLIGDFSSLEIFLFPLSTALSELNDQYRRYTIIKEVGTGTFGSVWRALSKQSGEVSLRKMNHPNIVKLKEVIRENDVLFFVFEYMECNLYQLMKDRGKPFSEMEVRNWCFQVFQGLASIHQRGYFHRDLKPENLLVSKDIIKVADFGLAREINSQPPFTEYVSTRWYRALKFCFSHQYMVPQLVNMWAMGAIMAELFTLRPLFPGSSEADEIYKICCVIGSPTKSMWPQGLDLASAINYKFPQVAGVHLSALIQGVSEDAINLVSSCFYVPPSLRSKAAIAKTPPVGASLEQKSARRHPGRLSNPKPVNSFSSAKPQASLSSGVQRKLDLNINNQDVNKNDKNPKNYVKQQPKYRPPGLIGPHKAASNLGKARGVSDAAEKLANMSLGSGRPLAKRASMPPPMKAGGWHEQSDMFVGRSQELPPLRSYIRKVAG